MSNYKKRPIHSFGKSIYEMWDNWLSWFLGDDNVRKLIPLFDTRNDTINGERKEIVKVTKRKLSSDLVMVINGKMVDRIFDEVEPIYEDYKNCDKEENCDKMNKSDSKHADGFIYMAFMLKSEVNVISTNSNNMKSISNDEILPLYIGKTGTLGNNGKKLCSNISKIFLKDNTRSKGRGIFVRWGTGEDHHIGALSKRFYNPKGNKKKNYDKWIDKMFIIEKTEKNEPVLKAPVYFQIRSWFPNHDHFKLSNPLIDYCGKSTTISLDLLECLLVVHCKLLFPEFLANA
jgi:hypothetical protein